jgi:hypothetical protein
MIYKMAAAVFFAILLGLVGCAAGGYTQYGMRHRERIDSLRVMTQQDVITLSKAGVSDSLIIAMMDATHTWFQLNAQDVINLKDAGVSENVIGAMLAEPPQPPEPSRYYDHPYPPYYWYDGFYPFWYYPAFSAGFGYYPYRSFYFHSYNFHNNNGFRGQGGRGEHGGSRSSGRHR